VDHHGQGEVRQSRRGAPNPSEKEFIADLEAYIPNVMRATGTPGMGLALARRGEIIWEVGVGYDDLADGTPMLAENTAKVGSFSKLYTAVALMQLVEERVLDLYRPVNEYLSDFRLVNPLGERDITTYDLLTMRAGLGTDALEGGSGTLPRLGDYLSEQLASGRGREYHGRRPRWTAKVGTRYEYSTLGVAIIGYLVEVLNREGLSYAGYIRQRIFEPLGMHSSAFDAPEEDQDILHAVRSRLSQGYARFNDTYVPTPPLRSAASPSASLMTTPGDHLRMLLALLRGGEWGGQRILAAETVAQMLTPQVQTQGVYPELDNWNGLMVQLTNPGRGDYYFGHGGAFPWGWNHDSRAYPGQDLVIVGFTNKWDMIRWLNPPTELAPSLLADYAARRLQGLEGAPQQQPTDWRWMTAYVMGAMLVERCSGMIGESAILTPEQVDAMVAGARTLGIDRRVGMDWDSKGFVDGATDMAQVDMTPDSIRCATISGAMRVPSRELPLIALQFGRRGPLPLPMPYFARPSGPAADADT
jgi:CubicO group peptidase (beta-lactamase class C family)